MLFRKKIPRSCQYCAFSAKMGDEQMLCPKRGIVSTDFQCRKFRYDPIKRIPSKPKALDLSKYDNNDFSL